jgi:PilZ domain
MAMTQDAEKAAEATGAPPGFDELRAAPRFSLMIRAAKLVCASGEYLCVVRDISATGTRLKLFHDAPSEVEMILELSNGERFAMERMWSRDGHVGCRFAALVDVDRFIGEASPFRRRPVRLRLQRPALIIADGLASAATLLDLSQQGARIESDFHLSLDQQLRLEVDALPTRIAKVRWRHGHAYGLVFEQTFRLDELAQLAWQLETSALARPETAQNQQLR